jgi:pentatricopeptide repeat protein
MLGNALLDMYAKCGELEKAREVLEELPVRNAVSWNALITGYAEGDRGEEAWSSYVQMQSEGLSPDEVTMLSVLKACASAADVDKGKQAHDAMVSKGLPVDLALGNALVDMYAKCNALAEAERVFDGLPNRTVVSCNALISGYARQGRSREALSWYARLQSEHLLEPDTVTFIYICKACGDLGAIGPGERVRDEIVSRRLLDEDAALGNAVVDMYARCGMLEKAREVLDELPARDAVSWNALIGGLVHEGRARDALGCFEQMRSEGLCPDAVSFLWALKACESIGAADTGEQIHAHMLRSRVLEKDGGLLGAALVGMYARCGLLGKAEEVLKECHDDRSSVSWNALIRGYAEQGQWHRALARFEPMLLEGICSIDATTFVCMLKACASTGAAVVGERIHGELVRSGFLLDDDRMLSTALIDMYAKCGRLEKAEDVLRGLRARDKVSWSALIAGYAQRGRARRALDCFVEMKIEGFVPDEITFSSLLSACTRSGLLHQAQMLFDDMTQEYDIAPSLEHLTCILAAFGYAGRLDEAVAMLGAMPASDRPEAWLALLGACKKWGNVDVARLAFARALVSSSDHDCAAAYILMATIFASSGMHEDAERFEALSMRHSDSLCK